MKSSKFWIPMIIFQVAFGLAVFAITRHFYTQEGQVARTHSVAAEQAAAPWPERSKDGDLGQLISTFPGQSVIKDPATISMQADDYFAKQQYEQAADLYQHLISVGSNSADTYNNLGITLHYLGRSGEAIEVLNEGAGVDPAYQRIWLTLGFVNSQVGNIDQARDALNRAVQIDAGSEVGQSATHMLDALGPG